MGLFLLQKSIKKKKSPVCHHPESAEFLLPLFLHYWYIILQTSLLKHIYFHFIVWFQSSFITEINLYITSFLLFDYIQDYVIKMFFNFFKFLKEKVFEKKGKNGIVFMRSESVMSFKPQRGNILSWFVALMYVSVTGIIFSSSQ